MRAVVVHQHGGLDKLVLESAYRDPVPGPQDTIVGGRACALNYHDVFTRKGMPGINVPLPLILGNDMAGEVVAVGADVKDFRPGDRVLVDPTDRVDGGFLGDTRDGGLAEFVKVAAHMLIRLDPAVGFAEAAALPVA